VKRQQRQTKIILILQTRITGEMRQGSTWEIQKKEKTEKKIREKIKWYLTEKKRT